NDNVGVHHFDFIRNGIRVSRPLFAVDGYTTTWPTTLVWNGSMSASAFATDTSGNRSPTQDISFNINNAYVTNTFSQHVCYPATSTCSQVAGPFYLPPPLLTLPGVSSTTMNWSVHFTQGAVFGASIYVQSCDSWQWTIAFPGIKSKGTLTPLGEQIPFSAN